MDVWCRLAHRRFWTLEERYVDAFGFIEYWTCTLCRRRWTLTLPPIESSKPPTTSGISR